MRNSHDWPLYFEKTKDSPARENLQRAIKLFEEENICASAVDIGSGAGNDIRFLLKKGWKIIAFDKDPTSIKMIQNEFGSASNLTLIQADFSQIKFEKVELINCSYVLPFCEVNYFDKLMTLIQENIKPNGRFSGNFFGNHHEWVECTLKTKEEVLEMFKDFEIEYFMETEVDKKSALGVDTHFHNFDLVAKKLI